MAQFDPAAATAAYLAQLPPQAHAKAQAYTHGDHWLLLWNLVVSVAIAWLILRSGVLVRLRERLEAGKGRPWLAALAIALAYFLAEALLSLPWSAYTGWWRELRYGFTTRPFAGWLGEHLMSAAIMSVLTALLVAVLYALMRRSPRRWWLWGAGVTSLFILAFHVAAPIYLQPLFNRFEPAPPGPVREAVAQLARENGVPPDKIYVYNGSKQSTAYTANVAGLFGTARVAMSDTMFAKGADVPEVRAVVGHEMGHYVLRHTLFAATGMSLMALAAFFLIDRLFDRTRRLTGAEGVGAVSDPAGLPIISILITALAFLATPLENAVSRYMENQADEFSLERVNEPDGLSRALVKTIEYRAATPPALEEAVFYSHPAVGTRIRRAMEWKARHPRTAGRPRPGA